MKGYWNLQDGDILRTDDDGCHSREAVDDREESQLYEYPLHQPLHGPDHHRWFCHPQLLHHRRRKLE